MNHERAAAPPRPLLVRILFTACLSVALAAAAVRAIAYLLYVWWHRAFPLETHALEATMVHHAWRVLDGSALYPAWEHYPHVTNFFTPLYFWTVGLIGRAVGADIPDLFGIGRSVSVLSALSVTGCLAWYLSLRHGRSSALIGVLLSVGTAPLYGFSIMTRPDVMADAAGVAGFLLATRRGRGTMLAAGAVLAVAILTKQTAGIYLAAAVVMCVGDRRYAEARWLAGTSTVVTATVAIILMSTSAPLFLRSIVEEGHSPMSMAGWLATVGRLFRQAPEVLILSVAGMLLWWRQTNHGLVLAVGALLAGSLLAALKTGADLNYFLPLRTTAVLAGASLWAAARATLPNRRSWQTAAAAGVALLMVPSTLNALAAARDARSLRAFVSSPSGALMLETYDGLIRLMQTPDVRVLTDCGLLALYQKDRAPFVDPWLFRLLVTTARISPAQMEAWLDAGEYDFLILTADLHSSGYETYEFGLPPALVRKARARYGEVGQGAGLYIYRPHPAS